MLLQCSCLSSQGTLRGSKLVSTDPESQYIGFHRAEEGFCPEFCLIFRQFLTLFDVKTNPWGCVCVCVCARAHVCVCALTCGGLFAIQRTVAHQASVAMEFFRQENWSGLPFPPPGDLPNPGVERMSPALASGFFTTEPPGGLQTNP